MKWRGVAGAHARASTHETYRLIHPFVFSFDILASITQSQLDGEQLDVAKLVSAQHSMRAVRHARA